MKNKLSYSEFWEKLPILDSFELEKHIHLVDPQNRSSAIFPVYLRTGVETRIQFLSYWLQKKENNILLRITTRNLLGNQIDRIYQSICKYKSNEQTFDHDHSPNLWAIVYYLYPPDYQLSHALKL